MTERHEEYMKRRLREEHELEKLIKGSPIDIDDPGDLEIKVTETPNYKYNEDALIKEFKAYIDATYSQHYSRDKFQATEFIMDGGHGTGFCVGNVLKYAQRYGKKGSQEDARKDLMKVLHYALLQLYVHDIENEQ